MPANRELPLSEVVERAFARFDAGEATDAEVQLLRSAIEARCERAGLPSPFVKSRAQRQRQRDEMNMPSIHRADRRGATHFGATAGSSSPWPAPVRRETISDRQFAYDTESTYAHLGADVVEEAHRLRREHQQLVERVGTAVPEARYVALGLDRFRAAEEREAHRRRTDDRGAAELERHRRNSAWHLPGDPQN
mgnify:CR=1 FL=1